MNKGARRGAGRKSGGMGMIRSVDKAAVLLSQFSAEDPVLGVGELSKRCDFHKSTVSRLMATLARRGLVVQDPVSREYRIGPEVTRLARVYLTEASHVHGERRYRDLAGELAKASDQVESGRAE